jgi:DNA-binding beta-propeller fold protein YncE
MKLSILLALFMLQLSCSSDIEEFKSVFPKNIAVVTNQKAGYITLVDLTTKSILKEVDLNEPIHNFSHDRGEYLDHAYNEHSSPHYAQIDPQGKYLYIVLLHKTGAIVKMDSRFKVVDFFILKDSEYPAHLQINANSQKLYISSWTTTTAHGGTGTSTSGNYMVALDANFKSSYNYLVPAGSHGIKLNTLGNKIILGHDLCDYISVIDLNNVDREDPLNTAKALTSNADINGTINCKFSPTQVAISPDDKFAFFSCQKSGQILVYDLIKKDTLGFLSLKNLFNVDNSSPYSIAVGPKKNYADSTKYIYINLKGVSTFARIKFEPDSLNFEKKFSVKVGDKILLQDGNARPHGLDLSYDGKTAIISSEYRKNDNTKADIFLIDLEHWLLSSSFQTKPEARGLSIYE